MKDNEIITKLDEVAAAIARETKRVNEARASLGVGVSTLATFPDLYKPLIDGIAERLTAEPTVTKLVVWQQQMDGLIADFLALQATATAAVAAIPAA